MRLVKPLHSSLKQYTRCAELELRRGHGGVLTDEGLQSSLKQCPRCVELELRRGHGEAQTDEGQPVASVPLTKKAVESTCSLL